MISDTTRQNGLGSCPSCNATITSAQVLIEYETEIGRKAYAECPGCREVVHPE